MIENWLFIAAMLAVLLIPGPTNALLANSAYQQGFGKTFTLVPAELLGYLYGISIWALLVHLSLPIWPMLIDLLHVASALYVFWLAFHLWKTSHLETHGLSRKALTPSQLFISTLKNPKTILFAAGIFPVETWDSFAHYFLVMGIFSLCLIPCAVFWMYWGRKVLAGNMKGIRADQWYKGSALFLVLCMLPVVVRFF
ncbi:MULTISPECIES: LysE family transporter [unclassified Acinetobacter]|uniref:LysE family translocator n=1 Tax=unclassified Acinetobacter TaxID=196816 RepID=UPI002578584A|nr:MULTISPECIES: LysE family transporter [unclassified Acinetobacter]MDM1764302.1 LysE family transporter [Acinetobacter sp. 226-1]MDM1767801.1 LysE family transporter [Acinetobacter sp. 226-4]